MNTILADYLGEKEHEYLRAKELCESLNDLMEDEETAFTQIYDALMSGAYSDIICRDFWKTIFEKYNMPFKWFIHEGTVNETAVLDYGDFIICLPLHDCCCNSVRVRLSFCGYPPAFNNISYYEGISQKASNSIKKLTTSCLTKRATAITLCTKNSFMDAISETKDILGSKFIYINGTSTLLNQKTKDKYICSLIELLDEIKNEADTEVLNAKKRQSEASEQYTKVKSQLDEVLENFKGSLYVTSIVIDNAPACE